jgi:hypothetical protein
MSKTEQRAIHPEPSPTTSLVVAGLAGVGQLLVAGLLAHAVRLANRGRDEEKNVSVSGG